MGNIFAVISDFLISKPTTNPRSQCSPAPSVYIEEKPLCLKNAFSVSRLIHSKLVSEFYLFIFFLIFELQVSMDPTAAELWAN